jgi:hypothetical protein
MIAASIGTIDSVQHIPVPPPSGTNVIAPLYDTTGNVNYSNDGSSWGIVPALTEPGVYPLTDSCWSDYFNSFFVCANQTQYSPGWSSSADGITWTDSASVTIRNWNLISQFGSGASTKLCSVASEFSAISSNGTTWTEFSSGPSIPQAMVWAAGLGKLVVVSSTSSAYTSYTSTDGYNWTGYNSLPTTGFNYNSVAWSESLGLLVTVRKSASTAGCVYTSTDGITWTARTASLAKNWLSVEWSSTLGLFIVVGNNGIPDQYNQYMYSYNGLTWYTGSINTGLWMNVVWSAALSAFVVWGYGVIALSSDGLNWTYSSSPRDGYCGGMAAK